MVERGIYDLSTWIAGIKYLPPVKQIPIFFVQLGFQDIPLDKEEVKTRYRTLAKEKHPDVGGNEEEFQNLKIAAEQAMKHFENVGEKKND